MKRIEKSVDHFGRAGEISAERGDVAARNERPPLGGKDDGAHAARPRHIFDGVAKRLGKRHVQRIEDVGSVEDETDDARGAVSFDPYKLAHLFLARYPGRIGTDEPILGNGGRVKPRGPADRRPLLTEAAILGP